MGGRRAVDLGPPADRRCESHPTRVLTWGYCTLETLTHTGGALTLCEMRLCWTNRIAEVTLGSTLTGPSQGCDFPSCRKSYGGIDLGSNGTHVVTAAVVDVASLVVTRHRFALNGSDGVGKMARSRAYRPSKRTPAPDYRTAPYPPIYYSSGLILPFSLDTSRLRTVPHSRLCWKRYFLLRTATSRSVSHVAANFAESDIGGSVLTAPLHEPVAQVLIPSTYW